jgi:hypothetical protein
VQSVLFARVIIGNIHLTRRRPLLHPTRHLNQVKSSSPAPIFKCSNFRFSLPRTRTNSCSSLVQHIRTTGEEQESETHNRLSSSSLLLLLVFDTRATISLSFSLTYVHSLARRVTCWSSAGDEKRHWRTFRVSSARTFHQFSSLCFSLSLSLSRSLVSSVMKTLN